MRGVAGARSLGWFPVLRPLFHRNRSTPFPMTTLTPQNWQAFVTELSAPAFVIFHSPYSAYSRRSLTLLLKLEPQFPTVRFGSLDVDAHLDLARLHGIGSIPAFVIYRGGEKRAQFIGERSEKRLVENIGKAFEP
jgi:thioredoxin-like negative regulator of GroEL